MSTPSKIKLHGTVYRLADFNPTLPIGYTLDITYSSIVWTDPEGDDYKDSHGFVTENVVYSTLEELARDLQYSNRSWSEWSGSPPQPGDWIVSTSEENYETGEHISYGAHPAHADGSPLTPEEMNYLHRQLKLLGIPPRTAQTQKVATEIVDIETVKQVKQELHIAVVNKPWFRGIGIAKSDAGTRLRLNVDAALENADYVFPAEFMGVPVEIVFIDEIKLRSSKADAVKDWRPVRKDIRWGDEPWPSDLYIQEAIPDPPPMERDRYYELRNQQESLYREVDTLKRDLKQLDSAGKSLTDAFTRLHNTHQMRWTDSEEVKQQRVERLKELKKQLLDVKQEREQVTEEMRPIESKLVDLSKELLPAKTWLEQYDPRAQRLTHFSSATTTQTILYKGNKYKLAQPELGSEYSIPVTAEELDPEVVLWFHSGQGDPIYALGSRLYSYDSTLASLGELEALKLQLEEALAMQDTVEQDLLRIEDTLAVINQKIKER